MTTYYVDPSIGNDSNSFTQAQSQATPWATAAKVGNVSGTNLITYSEDFTNVLWTQPGVKHVTGDTTSSPDGLSTADTFTAHNVAYGGLLRFSVSFSSIGYTFSFYVKKINHSYIGIRFKTIGTVGDTYITFNLDTQVWTNTTSVVSYSASDVGGGWWRISITGTPTAGTAYCDVGLVKSNGSSAIAPAGTEQAYIWGAKLTEGVLTPYKLFPGDSVLFKKGSTFAETLSVDYKNFGKAGSPITYGSYGVGVNPIVLGIAGNGTGDYITIDGIDAAYGAGISILGFNNLIVKNLTSSHSTSSGVTIDENTAGGTARSPINTVIENVECNYNFNRGLWLKSTGTVSNFTAHDNGANAISSSPGTVGGVLTFNGIELYDNVLYGFATAASVADTVINIYRMKSYRNVGGYLSHAQISAVTNIYYSLIYENDEGIIVGSSTEPFGDTNIYNCTIANNDNQGVYILNTSDIIIKNSILHGNGEVSGYNLRAVSAVGTLVSDYNIITQNTAGRSIYVIRDNSAKTLAQWKALDAGIYDQHSLGADPQFIDPANSNYRLQSTSPAINAGTR